MPDRFGTYVARLTRAADGGAAPPDLQRLAAEGLRELVAKDDWLPAECAIPGDDRYRQYLLHKDPQDRFSILSFVWGPGQATPIHDHGVWGVVGILRGLESNTDYRSGAPGTPMSAGETTLQPPGTVVLVDPSGGDVHRVANAHDGVSISIHVYGADIGTLERRVYDPATSRPSPFVSGYSPRGG